MLPRLAIITTHPIQYNAPIFKLLTERGKIDTKVFYTWEQAREKVYDVNFKREIKWDIPLLEGYDFTFVKNVAKQPGSHHFKGIDNPALIAEVQRFKPDAVLVFGWAFKSHLSLLRNFKGKVPLLFRGDSTALNDHHFAKKLLRKLFLSWVYKHIDKALYVGKRNKEYYIEFGLRNDQLIYAPHAIDNNRFSKSPDIEIKVDWRSQLNISEDDTVLLFAGKLEPRKNPMILINAFKRLGVKNMHLVMVGNGELEQEIKSSSLGFRNIHFVDFQNQKSMPSIYKLADIFVLPSKSETWGLAVNEAMACGKPVLLSDKCGCAVDLVEEGVNGYTFQSENVEDLLKKLELLSKKIRKDLALMGEVSYAKIQNWSFESICSSIESAIF